MIVEILLIAARSPLEEQEIAEAVKLMRTWGEMERIPTPKMTTIAADKGSSVWLKPKSLKTAASSSIAVVAIVNWIMFMMIIPFKNVYSSR